MAAVGVLSFVDNHVDSATGTVMLKAKFPNADGSLWPGEFVDVTLILGIQADATVVPAQAVVTAQSGTFVFVVGADGTARQQAVTVQRTVDTLAVIADGAGLAPGALVVTDGQLRTCRRCTTMPRRSKPNCARCRFCATSRATSRSRTPKSRCTSTAIGSRPWA